MKKKPSEASAMCELCEWKKERKVMIYERGEQHWLRSDAFKLTWKKQNKFCATIPLQTYYSDDDYQKMIVILPWIINFNFLS